MYMSEVCAYMCVLTSHSWIAVHQYVCLPTKLHVDKRRQKSKNKCKNQQHKYLQIHDHNHMNKDGCFVGWNIMQVYYAYICQGKVANGCYRLTQGSKASELKHLQASIAHGHDVDYHEHVDLHNVLIFELF